MKNYLQYYYHIIPAILLSFALFVLINFLRNPYRKSNKAFAKCTKSLQKNNYSENFVRQLTPTYRFQWKLFQTSNVTRPSQVFTFYKQPYRTKMTLMYVLSCIFVTFYTLCGVYFYDFAALLVCAIFVLASALTFIMIACTKRRHTQKAQKIFAQFVVMLNKRFEKPVIDTAQKIDAIKNDLHDDSLEKASKVLAENGLNAERTPDEQRKVNVALNGLLQAYARAQTN